MRIAPASQQAGVCHSHGVLRVNPGGGHSRDGLHCLRVEVGNRFVGWLVGWLVGWSVGQLACWSVGQLVRQLVVWLLFCWLVGWLRFGWLLN